MDLFAEEVDRTGTRDWHRRTPCTDWTVADLVRHTADTADRASAIIRGETWQASDSPAGPAGRWAEASAELRGVLAGTKLDDRWPLPPESANAKLLFHACDFAVHTWDLAVGRGEERELPSHWVAFMDSFFRSLPVEVLRRPRAFHDPVQPAEQNGPTRRLMAFLGRRPLT